MMVRQPLWLAVGWIHADSVIAELRFSEAELATRTKLFVPLKLRALPKRPWVDQVAPFSSPCSRYQRRRRGRAGSLVESPRPHQTRRRGHVSVVASAAPEYHRGCRTASTARTR